MKVKTLLFFFLAVFTLTIANAQKVKIKKGIVSVDGKETFTTDKKGLSNSYSLFTLDGEKEIIFVNWNSNETVGYGEDDFVQVTFLDDNLKIESATSLKISAKNLFQLLIKDKVINLDGTVNPDKLDRFFTKYDENITDRTTRF
ncbi:hypothetical protein [Neptunitalea lumnitzerae]|uniref:Uncharacterized protein n=1 Tax=Neptunitalea lumnitzerae TaxID=2965509 RepID=A0ABQ5MF05_9FLAO|nr:hypothetical protein [Neptunitalea sp. Y10]GLB47958.1 hypothetical protein Y10_03260 [Neptunitalea sp. Y10]